MRAVSPNIHRFFSVSDRQKRCRTRWACWASVSLGIHWNQERTQILVVQCQKKGIGIHQKTTDPTNLCYSLHRSWEIMAHHQTFYSDTEHVMLAVVFKCPFYTHFPWHTNQINQILIIDQTRQTADFKNDLSGEDVFRYLQTLLVLIVFKSCKTSSNMQEPSKMEQRPQTSSGRRLELHCALHHHLPNTHAQKNPPTLRLSDEVGAKTANSKPCFCCDSKHLEHESSDWNALSKIWSAQSLKRQQKGAFYLCLLWNEDISGFVIVSVLLWVEVQN